MKKLVLILVIGTLVSFYADAGRKPCFGSKGGISHHMAGGKFVCNDGSINASKKTRTNQSVKGVPQENEPTSQTCGKNPRVCPYLDAQAMGAAASLSPSRNRSSQSVCRVSMNARIVLLSQGPGFTVITSEVRALASRSVQAAKEIEGPINESVRLIDLGTDEVATVGKTMSTIVDVVASITHIIQGIAIASDEQNRGITQVSQAISEMGKATQRNTSLVEKASIVALSFEEQVA